MLLVIRMLSGPPFQHIGQFARLDETEKTRSSGDRIFTAGRGDDELPRVILDGRSKQTANLRRQAQLVIRAAPLIVSAPLARADIAPNSIRLTSNAIATAATAGVA